MKKRERMKNIITERQKDGMVERQRETKEEKERKIYQNRKRERTFKKILSPPLLLYFERERNRQIGT